MRRIATISALVSGAFMLAGCSSQPMARTNDQSGGQEQVQTQPQEKTGGVSDWIAGLTSGKKMQCEYSMGGEVDKVTTVKMLMDKDRYRTEVVTQVGTIVSLSDGKTVYTWTEGAKQGTKIDLECAKSLKDDLPKTPVTGQPEPLTYDTPEQAVGNIPDIRCSEAVGSIDLSIPTDMQFTDQCAMLKATLGKMQDIKNQLPDSVRAAMPK
ncbi:MAG: hypothetical protein HGA31_03705 [Candidatus Moranbacteria bacterium]|nr:hypothetical protein [Candidatus Moranbacteria bacterium]